MAWPLLNSRCMGKQILLSAEVSRVRALLAAGGSSVDAYQRLRQWIHQVPLRGNRRMNSSLRAWNEDLCAAIQDTLQLGAPVGVLLRQVQPMVRREERHWTKLQGIEKQFGFQGGLAVVIPWSVASLSGGIGMNLFSFGGFFCQILGLGLFYATIRRATRRIQNEQAWVFEVLVSTWMRCLAGQGLRAALEAVMARRERSRYLSHWQNWLAVFDGGANEQSEYGWPERMVVSRETSSLMSALLKTGAPASEVLADAIHQLDDERQTLLEERLASVPTTLSLIFCAFFTPAVFLILIGALWPTLSVLSI